MSDFQAYLRLEEIDQKQEEHLQWGRHRRKVTTEKSERRGTVGPHDRGQQTPRLSGPRASPDSSPLLAPHGGKGKFTRCVTNMRWINDSLKQRYLEGDKRRGGVWKVLAVGLVPARHLPGDLCACAAALLAL